MKKTFFYRVALFMFAAIFLCSSANSQSRSALNKVERANKKALQGGADIVLDPIEQVPVGKTKANRMADAPTNWGVDLLLPVAIKARLQNECTKPVILKIYDTAPNYLHTALQAGKLAGSNYTGEAGTDDGNGHSTHCAGIAVGSGFGIASVLVERGLLQFKPVQILTKSGSGSFNMVTQAIAGERAEDQRYITSGRPVVVSGSFGGGTAIVSNVESELKKSSADGVLFIFAAGNTGQDGVNYPGKSPYGVAIAALQQSPLTRAPYSTMGPEVVTAAPGSGIFSSYKGNTYATLSGTSMATPFVSGLTCIALSKWGSEYLKTPAQLRSYLAWVCSDIAPAGRDNQTGYGVAYVISVLDKDPKYAPTDPSDPADPPTDPPTDPVFPARKLTIPVNESYTIGWILLSGGSSVTGSPVEPATYTADTWAAQNTFTITSIDVTVSTSTDLPTTHKRLITALKTHFSGRGYALPQPADGATALYWAAYFAEMLLKNGNDGVTAQNIRVVNITGRGPSGETVSINDANLRHYNQ